VLFVSTMTTQSLIHQISEVFPDSKSRRTAWAATAAPKTQADESHPVTHSLSLIGTPALRGVPRSEVGVKAWARPCQLPNSIGDIS
jgi:hypothetical protein